MITYLLNRLLTMVGTLLAVSVLVFVIIQLPPGDYQLSAGLYRPESGERLSVLNQAGEKQAEGNVPLIEITLP